MSNNQQQPKDIEAQLTLRDRLNYPYYLGDAILTCNRAIMGQEYSHDQIVEATKNLRRLIPKNWQDEQFEKDLEEATIEEKKDIRPMVAGNIKLGEEVCQKLGVKTTETIKTYDYEKLGWACINLLERRGMLSKKVYTEWMTGQPYPGEGQDIADSEITEL